MYGLSKCNPAVTAVYFLAVTVLVAATGHPLLIALLLAGALSMYFTERVKRKRSFHVALFILFAILSIFNPLFSHSGATVLFVLNDSPVTLEALLYGVFQALMIVSVVYLFSVFSKIMTEDKLFFIFGLLSPKFALVFTMALRCIPLLTAKAAGIGRAQRAAGLASGENALDRLKDKIGILSALTTWALENGVITADSMAARGYGIGKRKNFHRYTFRLRDGALLGVILLLTAAVSTAALSGALRCAFYPYFDVGKTTFLSVFGVISFAALVFLPSLLTVTERIRWNCLRSKI